MHAAIKRIVLILSLLAGIGRGTAQNMVVNPGFENGLMGWVPFSTNSAFSTETVTSTNPYSGSGCLALTVNNASVISNGALQSFSVIPLQHYLLEYSVRTDSVKGIAYPYLNFGDSTVNYEYGLMPVNGTTGWQRFQSRFTVPAGSNTNLILFLILSGTRGSAYFDDVSLNTVTDTTWSAFTVNAVSNSGLLKNLQGTNTGPVKLTTTADLTTNFQQTGIRYVRTHDYYGACDISTIFPDTSKSATDPTAYSFAASDSVIAGIVNAGGQVLFRLGESFELPPIHNYPPFNTDKWADVCVQIAKHYNQGWLNGFNYNIKEWEIWNEPDGSGFWNGTANDFVKLYRTVSRKLKQYDNSLLVGGPALASLFSSPFLNTFLDSVNIENLPLDFFSYHLYYNANPYHFKYADSLAKTILAAHNLPLVKTYVTEWNPLMYSGNISQLSVWHNSSYISSQAASAMSYWQDNGPDKVFWYRTDEYLFGLFDEQTGSYRYAGRTMDAVNRLNATPYRLQSNGGDRLGKTIIAGRSQTGDSLRILISDHASAAHGYQLAITNLAAGNAYLYKVYRVVVPDSLSTVGSGIVSSVSATLSVSGQPPFTDIIELTRIATAGIHANVFQTNALRAYPNPASESLLVWTDAAATGKKELQLFNSTGALVAEYASFLPARIALSGLVNGLYFIRLKQEPQNCIKFIKE